MVHLSSCVHACNTQQRGACAHQHLPGARVWVGVCALLLLRPTTTRRSQPRSSLPLWAHHQQQLEAARGRCCWAASAGGCWTVRSSSLTQTPRGRCGWVLRPVSFIAAVCNPVSLHGDSCLWLGKHAKARREGGELQQGAAYGCRSFGVQRVRERLSSQDRALLTRRAEVCLACGVDSLLCLYLLCRA